MGRTRALPSCALRLQAERLLRERSFVELEQLCRRILAADPAHPTALHHLGLVALAAHDHGTALGLIERAVARRPRDFAAMNSLGLVLQARADHARAVKVFRRVAALAPQLADAHANLGIALRDTGDLDGARTSFTRALALDSGHANAHYGMAICSLLAGCPDGAWPGHEWRVASQQGRAYAEDPRAPGTLLPRPSSWIGEDLGRMRLLVLNEQGLGDELFFLRFADALLERGTRLWYLGSAPAVDLLRASALRANLLIPPARLPEVDRVILAGDLPLLASTGRACGFPAPLRLAPDPAGSQRALVRLAQAGSPPYLGVSWRAGRDWQAGEGRTLAKSVPLFEFAACAGGWRGTIVVLQRNPLPGEVDAFARASARPVADLSDLNADLPAMSGVLERIDAYAGVSNTNMHLRAAVGRSADVLVPFPPEWRWQHAGPRSGWFPDFAVHRQEKSGDWSAAWRSLGVRLDQLSGTE